SEDECKQCPAAGCFRTSTMNTGVIQVPTAAGDKFLEVFAYPHFDESGAVDMVVEFLRDITDKKRLEVQLLQAQKMEAVARLAGGVAHDFNNLLSVIIGRADMLMNELDGDSPLRKDIREILDAGRRAERLTRQLLTFSRRQVLQPEIIDLNEVVRGLSDFIARVLGEDVNVEFFTDAQLGGIRADLSQLEQVLMNLVVNARDAMPEGGKLTIETANVELDEQYARSHADVVPGRYVMLAVSDTGIGMDEQTQQKIFEPFFTTKEEGRGTGLGLATVYGIVRQCGGYIWVYSEPGKGTTFKIYFPAVDMSEKRKAAEFGEIPRGSETVLVVEDDDAVRRFLEKALQSLGYEPLIAAGAEQALELVRESASPPELLLTDVVLADDDGRRLAERLCSEHPGLKVLFISGYTTNGIVHNGMLDEGINFLPKPFSLMALARKMREVLDGE
ncbi:MAG: response regulator, partial [Deltaproteobacteria bacterium]